MSDTKAGTRLYIQFVLFRGEQDLAHGTLLVTTADACACFGSLRAFQVPRPSGKPLTLQMQTGLVIDYSTDDKGAKLFLRLFEVDEPAGPGAMPELHVRFRSWTRIPAGYDTPDFESTALGDGYEFVFLTKWITE